MLSDAKAGVNSIAEELPPHADIMDSQSVQLEEEQPCAKRMKLDPFSKFRVTISQPPT